MKLCNDPFDPKLAACCKQNNVYNKSVGVIVCVLIQLTLWNTCCISSASISGNILTFRRKLTFGFR